MTQDEIIEMAIQAGFEEHQAKFDTRFEPFAKLVAKHVLMNIDPSKFMSWQEAFEVGASKEREACERVAGIALLGAEMDLAKRVLRAIRARGEA
jgi:hypothetical protein